METRLREHIEGLFQNAPKTKAVVELREELLQNLIDKYNDLLSCGKTEEAAYNISVASIGDISTLLGNTIRQEGANIMNSNEYMGWKKQSAIITTISVTIYILCAIPILLMQDVYGIIITLILVAIATGMLIYNDMVKPRGIESEETVVEEFKKWQTNQSDRSKALSAIFSAINAITLVIYFIISFTTGGWAYTWIIFIISSAAKSIIRAILELRS